MYRDAIPNQTFLVTGLHKEAVNLINSKIKEYRDKKINISRTLAIQMLLKELANYRDKYPKV
jgi:hypothetical protein